VVQMREFEVISADFYQSASETEVGKSSFPTQWYGDVHKTALNIWIIQIIADNSEGHVCVSVEWRCRVGLFIAFVCFVTGLGNIVLQMPRNRKKSNSEEKGNN